MDGVWQLKEQVVNGEHMRVSKEKVVESAEVEEP